jgi:hypothetical protein
VSDPETVPPLPAAADAALTRLLAQWVEGHRLADDGAAGAVQVLAAARAPQVQPVASFGYDGYDYQWWRAVLGPTERVLEHVMGQMLHPPSP